MKQLFIQVDIDTNHTINKPNFNNCCTSHLPTEDYFKNHQNYKIDLTNLESWNLKIAKLFHRLGNSTAMI